MPHAASGPESLTWKGDDVGYRAAHGRVWRARGRATEHSCADCGKPAKQWAYDRGDEPKWATIGDRTVPFSPNPERYKPLCRGCHVKLDRGEHGSGWVRPARCKQGHLFDEENTYVRADGERNCRRCALERRAEERRRLRSQGLTSRGTIPKRPSNLTPTTEETPA